MIDYKSINPLTLPSIPLNMKRRLPKTPCIYFAIDEGDNVQYVGKSVNPQQRWNAHHKFPTLNQMGEIRIAYLDCPKELLVEVEKALISWFKPPLNGYNREIKTRTGGITVVKTIVLEVPNLGERIKEARKRDNRNLTQIAAACNMSTANWYRIEDERQSIPEETLRIIEEVLGVDFGVRFE